jgi:hypothetical protein
MRDRWDVRLLALQAEFLTDLEGVRIANGNRIGALERAGLAGGPELARADKLSDLLAAAEKLAEGDLTRALKALPIYPWISGTVGLGDKQVGRLLGVIGDPCWRRVQVDENTVEWEPRTIGQLWSYCGYAVTDGVAPKRTRGQQASYNTEARTRCFLIAESCVKQRHSPYRAVYDTGREKYAEATHKQPCIRCGPSGKPALADSPLSDGHKHARALRLVAKEVLRDLWLAAGDQASSETQALPVAIAA